MILEKGLTLFSLTDLLDNGVSFVVLARHAAAGVLRNLAPSLSAIFQRVLAC